MGMEPVSSIAAQTFKRIGKVSGPRLEAVADRLDLSAPKPQEKKGLSRSIAKLLDRFIAQPLKRLGEKLGLAKTPHAQKKELSQALTEPVVTQPAEQAIQDEAALKAKSRFREGWSRLAQAGTAEEIKPALNSIMIGVGRNEDGECIGISRAVTERLRSKKNITKNNYKHLNQTLQWDDTYGLLSDRADKIIELPEHYEDGYFNKHSEKEIYDFLSSLSSNAKKGSEPLSRALHQGFLKEFSINASGFQKANSANEIEEALRKAGDGAMGYVFPGSHIFPVVNIKGHIFALPNCFESSPYADSLAHHCKLNNESESLGFAITKHKIYPH